MTAEKTPKEPMNDRGIAMKTKAKVAMAAVIGVLVLILIFQNLDAVPTRVFWYEYDMPLAMLLVVMLVVGFGAGVLVTGVAYRKRSKQ